MNSKYKTSLAALASAAIGAAAVAAVFVNTALAEGTPADAKAMLDKTIAALKVDKA
jgi:signal transduction histidine kinase